MKKLSIIALYCISTFYTTHAADQKDVATKALERKIAQTFRDAFEHYIQTGEASPALTSQDIARLKPARDAWIQQQHLKAELEAVIVKRVQQACKLYVKTGKISSILSPQDVDTLRPARNQHVLNTLQRTTATPTSIGLSPLVLAQL